MSQSAYLLKASHRDKSITLCILSNTKRLLTLYTELNAWKLVILPKFFNDNNVTGKIWSDDLRTLENYAANDVISYVRKIMSDFFNTSSVDVDEFSKLNFFIIELGDFID